MVVNHVAVSESDEVLDSTSVAKLFTKCYVQEFNENLHDPRVGLSWDDQRALDVQHIVSVKNVSSYQKSLRLILLSEFKILKLIARLISFV